MLFRNNDNKDPLAVGSRRAPVWRVTPRMAVCAAVAMALLAGAIPAIAATLAAKPVKIYACVTARTGSLRIVSASARCNVGQHKISWNSEGPRGPKGPPAIETEYESMQAPGVGIASTGFTTVNSLELPRGSFMVTALVPLHDLGLGTVECRLTDANGTIDNASVTVPLDTDSVGQGEITLTGGTAIGGAISVQCIEVEQSAQAVAYSRMLTAVPVTKISS